MNKQPLEQKLYEEALEIEKDDPWVAKLSFESFCNVMWPDDHDMKDYALDRETFRRAVRNVWQRLNRR
jgi:hypothetical protein